jgi:hypothetical protein
VMPVGPCEKPTSCQRFHRHTVMASFSTTVRSEIAKPPGETGSRRMFNRVARQGRIEREPEAYFLER